MDSDNQHEGAAKLPISKRLIQFSLRTFFKLLYHQLAWSYDAVADLVSLGNWQTWIQSVEQYLQGPQILEIGFGPGHLQVTLHQKGFSIYGLDESSRMVRAAQKRLKISGFHPRLVRGDAQKLPFAQDSFQQVVMTFPAEFILQQGTLSEINRILSAEGSVIILPFAWITGRKPWERFLAWVNRITGEAPDWNPDTLDALRITGFEPSWEMIELKNSKLVIIRLSKVRSQ